MASQSNPLSLKAKKERGRLRAPRLQSHRMNRTRRGFRLVPLSADGGSGNNKRVSPLVPTGVLSHFKEAVTMVHCVRWIFPVLLAGCFAAVTSAGGSEKPARFFPVKDEGEFFKDLSKPNQIIREIQERHHKEVLVHTHRAVKTEDRDKVEKMTLDERGK